MTPALSAVSRNLGQLLAQLATQAGTKPNTATTVLLTDPVTVATVAYNPLPNNAGFGLTAFYYALVAVIVGFLGASVVGPSVDAALGYAPSEVGPKRRQRMPVSITRTDTLLAKWAISIGLAPLLAGLIVLGGSGILRVYTPNPVPLWVFLSAVTAVVGIGTQALLAAFGTLGQLLAMIVFIALALPSSGGTVPLQAVPGFYRVLANFEPMRQIMDGVRAIMYFDARFDAGLARGWIMTGVGLVLWVAFGLAVTRHYDRRGLYRIQPEVLQALYATLPAFQARAAGIQVHTRQGEGQRPGSGRGRPRVVTTAATDTQQPEQGI